MTKIKKLNFGNLTIQRPQQIGVENIKVAFTEILIGIREIKQTINSFNGKTFDIRSIFSLALLLGEYAAKIPIFQAAFEEFKDGISPAESEKLAAHFNDVFDIPNDELENIIEQGVALIPETHLWVKSTVNLGGRWVGFSKKLKPFFNSETKMVA